MTAFGEHDPTNIERANAYADMLFPDATIQDGGKFLLATSVMEHLLDEYQAEHGQLPTDGLEMLGLASAVMSVAHKRSEQFDRWIIGTGFDPNAQQVLTEMDSILRGMEIARRQRG